MTYIKVVQHTRPASITVYKQAGYLLIASALGIAAVSLAMLIVHHWSLVLLLALVWLTTAFVTSRLLASDMRLLRLSYAQLRRHFLDCKLWFRLQIRHLALFWQQAHKQRRCEPPAVAIRRMAMPTQFPETPIPATPLIRVLETIDLSSTSVEHFLEEEKQTPGEVPALYELQQKEQFYSDHTK